MDGCSYGQFNHMYIYAAEYCSRHAPILSQAPDNRCVNPSEVNNTFLELAQGFQTHVHTYNPHITGEYITKFEKRNTKDVYIYIYIKSSCIYKHTTQRIHSI